MTPPRVDLTLLTPPPESVECAGCRLANESSARSCKRCGRPLASNSRPAGLLSAMPARTQHRSVVVLMTDLCGYTKLTEEHDPEDVAALLLEFRKRAGSIVQRHGGIVNQFVGDEILVLFGVPTASEDDARSAVDTALELHQSMRELDHKWGHVLRLHTGIDAGLVFFASHDPRGGIYEVTGDVINVAARLRSKAAMDEILVSAVVQRAAKSRFMAEPLELLELKGKSGRIPAFRVIGQGGTRPHFGVAESRAQSQSAFVGREVELAFLEQSLEQVGLATGQIVVVSGEFGIGKTRLIQEFARLHARSTRVLWGECSARGSGALYQPFVHVVQQILGRGSSNEALDRREIESALRERYPELVSKIPALLQLCSLGTRDPALGPQDVQESLADAMRELLLFSARGESTLLVLEDWDGADEGSRAMLRVLSRRLDGAPILVVVTRRPHSGPSEFGLASRLRVGHLDEATTARFVDGALPSNAASAQLSARIHAQTGGNPLFIEEICAFLLQHGSYGEKADRPIEIPRGVKAVIRARLDALGDLEFSVLQRAAIFPGEFTEELLAPLFDEAVSLRGMLSRLCQAELLYCSRAKPAANYRFRHEATREVAYESLSTLAKRALHGRLARLLESNVEAGLVSKDVQVELLADHFSAARSHAKAAHYATLAGNKAARDELLEQAHWRYCRALEHLEAEAPEESVARRRVELSLTCVKVRQSRPLLEDLELLTAARDLAQEVDYRAGLARCLYWMGRLQHALHGPRQAILHFEPSLQKARELGDLRLIAEIQVRLGQSYAVAAEYPEAEAHLAIGLQRQTKSAADGSKSAASEGLLVHDGASVAASGKLEDPGSGAESEALALGWLAWIHADRGDFQRAHGWMREALSIVHAAGARAPEASLSVQLAMIQLLQGDFAACLETALRVREIGEQLELHQFVVISRILTGYSMVHLGRPLALDELRNAARELSATTLEPSRSWMLACTAEALALAGEFETARGLAFEALELGVKLDRLGDVMAHRALGLIARKLPGSSEPGPHFHAALERALSRGSRPEAGLTYLRWAESVGSARRARSLYRDALELMSTSNMRFHAAIAASRTLDAEVTAEAGTFGFCVESTSRTQFDPG